MKVEEKKILEKICKLNENITEARAKLRIMEVLKDIINGLIKDVQKEISEINIHYNMFYVKKKFSNIEMLMSMLDFIESRNRSLMFAIHSFNSDMEQEREKLNAKKEKKENI